MTGDLIVIERPKTYGEVVNRHLPYLFATAPFLIAARLLPLGAHIGPGCLFKGITGIPCMFCGYTRSFQLITRMHIVPVLRNNPAALVLFVFMLAVMLFNLAGLASGRVLSPGRLLRAGDHRIVFAGVALFFVLNWIYRIMYGAALGFCI